MEHRIAAPCDGVVTLSVRPATRWPSTTWSPPSLLAPDAERPPRRDPGMSYGLTPEQQRLSDEVREFADTVVAPAAYEYDTERELPYEIIAPDGRDGAVRPALPGGVRRPGPGLRRPLPRGRAAGPRRPVHRGHARGRRRARRDADLPQRHARRRSRSGCRCSPGRGARGLRADGGRRRLGRGGDQDHRRARRRPVGDQRHQAVHHQLRHRDHAARDDHRGDGRERPAPTARSRRSSPRSWCPAGRPASPSCRPTTRSAGTPPTPTRCASRTSACRRRTCWASAAAASRPSSRPSTRAASRSPRCARAPRRAASRRRCATPRAATCSATPIGENQHIAFTIARMEARVHSARLAWYDAAQPAGRGPAVQARGQPGQDDRQRGGDGQRPRRDPDLRRLRLPEREPGGPALPRLQDPRDRRGHDGGPAHGHRARARVRRAGAPR